MEEIQEQNSVKEPAAPAENSQAETTNNEGQAQNAPSELLLGKFKSVDDLTRAYQELEKHQGFQSQELGQLREKDATLKNITQLWATEEQIRNEKDALMQASQKYNKPEYFQNPAFREIYKAAYLALGHNLDAERFIDLIENYVASRFYAKEREKAAQSETDKAISSMTFSKNNTSSLKPPSKRLDEMTPKEVDELLERLI